MFIMQNKYFLLNSYKQERKRIKILHRCKQIHYLKIHSILCNDKTYILLYITRRLGLKSLKIFDYSGKSGQEPWA